MGFTTTIECDNCSKSQDFYGVSLELAEKRLLSQDWTSPSPGKYLCVDCSWREAVNFFAIDIDLGGTGNPQVLALCHDVDCFIDTSMFIGPAPEQTRISVRRIEPVMFESLTAFGIPEVHVEMSIAMKEKDSSLLINCHHDVDYKNQKPYERVIHMAYKCINLSSALNDILTGTRPKAEVK